MTTSFMEQRFTTSSITAMFHAMHEPGTLRVLKQQITIVRW